MSESDYENLLNGFAAVTSKKSAVNLSLNPIPTLDAVEAVQIGGELGQRPEQVIGSPDIARAQAQDLRNSTALEGAPLLQNWLDDPINGALAKDDLDNLTWWENAASGTGQFVLRQVGGDSEDKFRGEGFRSLAKRRGQEFGGAVTNMLANIPEGLSTMSAINDRMARSSGDYQDALSVTFGSELSMLNLRIDEIDGLLNPSERPARQDRLSAEDRSRLESEFIDLAGRRNQVQLAVGYGGIDAMQAEAERETESGLGPDGEVVPATDRPLYPLGDDLRDMVSSVIGVAPDDESLGSMLAEGAGSMVPIIAAALLSGGGALGLSSGAALGGTAGASEQYREAKQSGASEDDALRASGLGGLVGLTEIVPIGRAFDLLPSGIKSKLGRVLSSRIAGMIAGGGEEALQEGLAGIANNLIAAGIYDPERGTMDNVGMQALVGAILGGGLGAAVSSRSSAPDDGAPPPKFSVLSDIISALASGRSAEQLSKIDQMAGESLLKQRSEAKFLDALEAAGRGDNALYVSAEGLQEYFQAKDVEIDDETLEAWGVDPADFAQKVLSGGEIAVPVSNYAARISGTDDAQWFRENSVFTHDEMSVAEAADFNSRVADTMDQEFERAETEREAELSARADDVKIEDGVFSGLRSAGRSPDVAKNEASVWGGFFRSMADRMPQAATDLAKMMGVRIQGPQTPEISRRRDQMDIMLNTLRSNGDKALAPSGPGVLDFVRSLGGVRDRGGDIEALDVPSDVIAETRAAITERESQPALGGAVDFDGKGRGLDDIGRAMIEAGYFPDLLGGADTQPDGTVVDEAALALEAITEAVAGRDRFVDGEGPNQELADLSALLSERGLDISEMSNDEIFAALQDSGDGQQYDQSGKLLTDTPEFKAWFGDSKVVDENGDPLVVYHGGSKGLTEFSTRKMGSASGQLDAKMGFFFSENADGAATYADEVDGEVTSVYLSIQNPMVIEGGDGPRNEHGIEKAKSLGHDGVVWRKENDGGVVSDVYIAFEPTQIKSVNNQGTFDASDPRILFQDGASAVESRNVPAETVAKEVAARTLEEINSIDGLDEVYSEMKAEDQKKVIAGLVEATGLADVAGAVIDGVVLSTDTSDGISAIAFPLLNVIGVNQTILDSLDNPQSVIALAHELVHMIDVDRSAKKYHSAKGREFEAGGSIYEEIIAERQGVEDFLNDQYGEENYFQYALEFSDSAEVSSELFAQLGALLLTHPEMKEVFPNGAAFLEKSLNQIGSKNTSEAKKQTKEAIEKETQPSEDLGTETVERMAQPVGDRELFQGEGKRRGSIVLPRGGLSEGETVINLFESANLSTFLHESGHFFLEAFTALATSDQAPQALKDDLEVILKFLGAEGGAKLTTEQHEAWARAFEAYLMEGKAPSLELASSFARFKAWLSRIYKTALGLNVKLNPEIREVMDRMLATDAEIAAMRDELSMRPLFTDAASAGMSAPVFATYQRMAQRGAEQGEQALMKRTMEKVRRETQKWFKDEKAAVRKEVEASVNKMPVYRLTEMATNQKWLGETDQDVPDIQIDRDALVEQFGDGVIAELGRSKIGGKRAIYTKNGARPEMVAQMFGFKSVPEMVGALQNAGKRKEFIAIEVDRIMVERHGDPLNDGSIEEAAALAVHSEQQSAMVAAEARAIAKRLGRSTRDIKGKVYRQRAKAMFGRLSVREASRPAGFLQAERRAAKAAEVAWARVARGGKNIETSLATAMQAKEQQLLNQYLYREAREFEKTMQRGREKMMSYGKKAVRAKLEGGYIEQIDALLERFDFRVRSQKQVKRAESLREYMDRMIKAGREAELTIDPRMVDEARKVHYTRLSVDEMNGFFDTITNIDHMGRFKQKLIDAQDARDLNETVSGVVGAMNKNVKGRKPGRTETSGDRTRKIARDYLNLTLNADTLLREVDGFGDMGPAWTAMKQRVDQGMARLVERRLKMAKDYDAIYARYSGNEQRDMSVKRHHEGLGDLFSKWDIIAIALNTGNETNYERLTNPKTNGGFTVEQVDDALSDLDARDWETVQMIWDHINSSWPEISAKEKRMTGVVPPKVEAKVMSSVAPASVSGGYYPIKYDSRLSGRVGDLEMKDLADSLIGGRFGKAQTKNGHTKERVRSVSHPLLLDLSVAHAHSAQVLYDLELGEAVAGSWRVLQDNRVKDAFLNKGKKADHEALEIWLQDVASGDQVASRGLEKYMRHLRTGFVISRLALNVSTALIQPTGLAQSAVMIGKRALAKGTISYMKNPARWSAEIAAVSPMMRERQITFERDIFNVVGDLEGGPVSGRWAKFQRDVVLPLSFVLMQKTQYYAVDMPTWVGAYEKELAASGDEAKSRLYADTMVKRSQGSGLMSDRGMLERGTLSMESRQREFPRMLTALGSYMFAKGNVAYERTMKTSFKSPVEVMSWAVDMMLLFTLEAVMYSAVKGYLPDEDEDEAAWLLKETSFSMMSTLPGLREVSGAMQGFESGGILGSIISKAFAKPVNQLSQGEADKAAVKTMIDMAGIWLHLPSSQTNAVINAMFEDDMGLRDDINPIELLGVGAGGNSPIEWMMQKN